MATLTPNYNLSKPDATDNFSAFRQSYNDNMDIIDANLGGGGGGGSAHTIVNESGTALADEPNLQFTDGLTATDDSGNSKTKVGVDTTFTESATRTNIASGESFATILGKIKKFFTDLKTVAFSGKSSDLNNDAGFITSSGSCASATNAGTANYANLLKYSHGNEINFSGGRQQRVWFNYRDADTDQQNGLGAIEYFFADYSNTPYNSVLHGARFTGKSDTAGTADKATQDSDGYAINTTYLKKTGGDMTGMLGLYNENNIAVNFRTNSGYYTTISYQTAGNEACVFATKNAITSWIFVNGEDSITNHASDRWQSLTPGLQVKNNCVSIGKLIPSGTSPSHELDVRGRARFDLGSSFVTTVQIGSSGSNGAVLLYNGNEGTLSPNTLSTDRNWKLPDKNGTIAMTSDISSRRFKENILPMTDDECKKILDVDVITFDYKAESNVVGENERVGNRGVIAEDVAELIPTAVEYEELDGEQVPYGVNYTKFIPYLIKMVQIQQKEINELKSMLADKEN